MAIECESNTDITKLVLDLKNDPVNIIINRAVQAAQDASIAAYIADQVAKEVFEARSEYDHAVLGATQADSVFDDKRYTAVNAGAAASADRENQNWTDDVMTAAKAEIEACTAARVRDNMELAVDGAASNDGMPLGDVEEALNEVRAAAMSAATAADTAADAADTVDIGWDADEEDKIKPSAKIIAEASAAVSKAAAETKKALRSTEQAASDAGYLAPYTILEQQFKMRKFQKYLSLSKCAGYTKECPCGRCYYVN